MSEIFVFGSNLAGIHGASAAKYALDHHGAVLGKGVGLSGNSYAIPTKDENIETMSLDDIKPYVDDFLDFAKENNHLIFKVTAIGTGLAGLKIEDIAPMFSEISDNIRLPKMFLDFLYPDGYDPNLISFHF